MADFLRERKKTTTHHPAIAYGRQISDGTGLGDHVAVEQVALVPARVEGLREGVDVQTRFVGNLEDGFARRLRLRGYIQNAG